LPTVLAAFKPPFRCYECGYEIPLSDSGVTCPECGTLNTFATDEEARKKKWNRITAAALIAYCLSAALPAMTPIHVFDSPAITGIVFASFGLMLSIYLLWCYLTRGLLPPDRQQLALIVATGIFLFPGSCLLSPIIIFATLVIRSAYGSVFGF
jgi:phage FluMu protein Com